MTALASFIFVATYSGERLAMPVPRTFAASAMVFSMVSTYLIWLSSATITLISSMVYYYIIVFRDKKGTCRALYRSFMTCLFQHDVVQTVRNGFSVRTLFEDDDDGVVAGNGA